MKILVVEDDPISAMVLESCLRQLGHDAVLAEDGEAAWKVLCHEPTRVVISDWLMPRLDGLDLCSRIRGRPGDYVYFILVTQRTATDENQDAAVEAGVDDFLTKPFNQKELWMRLRVAERILKITTEVRQLESFLPICSYCKKVRDDHHYWQQIESYVQSRVGTQFSHGVCPDCYGTHIVPMLHAAGVEGPGAPPTCTHVCRPAG